MSWRRSSYTRRTTPAQPHSTRIQRVAARKLKMIRDAVELNDLRVAPANRLESLRGDRRGQFSIRINDHWRICFKWIQEAAEEVEIVDYH